MKAYTVNLQIELPESFGKTPEEVAETLTSHYGNDLSHFLGEGELISGHLCINRPESETDLPDVVIWPKS